MINLDPVDEFTLKFRSPSSDFASPKKHAVRCGCFCEAVNDFSDRKSLKGTGFNCCTHCRFVSRNS